jgi:hypothetical protein
MMTEHTITLGKMFAIDRVIFGWLQGHRLLRRKPLFLGLVGGIGHVEL